MKFQTNIEASRRKTLRMRGANSDFVICTLLKNIQNKRDTAENHMALWFSFQPVLNRARRCRARTPIFLYM